VDELTVRWHPSPAARLRLFCAPHAGGGASVFRIWAERLAPDIEVIALRLPGRETRFGKPPYTSLDQLVPELVEELKPWLNRPHAWFGHSLGALVAFEACRELRRRAVAEPSRLLVAGRPAPQLPLRLPPVHAASEPVLRARLHELDGTPGALLVAPSGLSAQLNTLRADLRASELYEHRPEPPLDCPITVLGGLLDPYTTPTDLAAWRAQTTTDCTVEIFPGGHFFPHQNLDAVLHRVREDLGSTG
jgi:medium-chain acyl-[acyl-carrier-protein] hydrolase